tara:strand:+ start:352 stop:2277 length:1926 start_codon:yes stop_codon:yes gene_type:complete
MKSFSAFITEERKKGGRTGNMKFPGDERYRRMQDELSKKEKTKPRVVKQSEVSQQAKDYRTAQGEKRYQAAKTDVETRRGFQTGKGGLKADESNPYVNRQVRQQRAVKQGVPDPFTSKTPAPSDPFKGLKTGSKPQVPDPFKGASSVPELKLQGPARAPRKPTYATAGPATRQAMGDIAKSGERLKKAGIVLKPSGGEKLVGDPAKSIKKPSPPKVTPKAIGSEFYTKPSSTPVPKSPGDASTRPPIRAGHGVAKSRADAIRGGMKGASVGQDRRSGADLLDRLTGQKSGFQKFNQKAKLIQTNLKRQSGEQAKRSAAQTKVDSAKTRARVARSLRTARERGTTFPNRVTSSQPQVVNPSTNKPEFKNTGRSGYAPELKPKPGSEPVVFKPKKDPLEPFYRTTGGSSQPKVVNPSTNKPEFKNTGRSGYKPEFKPTSGSAPVSSKPGDITLAGPSEGKPRFPASKGSELAKKKFGQFSIDSGRGRGGALAKNNNIINVKVKDLGPTKQPALPRGSGAAKSAAKPLTQKSVEKMVKSTIKSTMGTIGKGAGRALGAAGSGIDAYMNYRKYRNQGDGKLRAGLKSAFRTSLGWLGGAAGATVGGLAGGVGAVGGGIAGYSGGTWLADKVLGATTKKKLGPKKK